MKIPTPMQSLSLLGVAAVLLAIPLFVVGVVLGSGMGGLDVYHEIKKMKPGIAALFMTGYSLEASGLGSVQKQGISVIRKPFTMAALGRKIRELLEAGNG